ncbi:MAG: argininosuccinate lyase [Deltaproteobacteria bacterium]|nr:argininosuccinate lyase [Deltaproteobacteria bacterium]
MKGTKQKRRGRAKKIRPTMWGGRFERPPAPEFWRINRSFPFDHRLLHFDFEGSIAWARALGRARVLNGREERAVVRALREVRAATDRNPRHVYRSLDRFEDVHSYVEAAVVEKAGEAGKKLHTGRSRNDQVALDLRMYVVNECDGARGRLRALIASILKNARRHFGVVLPAYTHLQRAQPVLLSHLWLAYVETLFRDLDRFQAVRKTALVLPLGSGACAGSGFPIDRARLAKDLGFAAVSKNSLDAVGDRDFAVEFLSAGALLMMHLSRMAEDLILYSTAEFGFVELDDPVTSGSSLMPQKKNPDALELVRGKTGRAFGNLQRLLVVMKALPLAYDKDMQEDKEAVFDTSDTIALSLDGMNAVVRSVRIDADRTREAASTGFQNATECADYLVRKGLPFRTAHEVVGRLVLHAIGKGVALDELPFSEFERFSPVFKKDIHRALSVDRCVASRSVPGGTAPQYVRKAIEDAERRLADDR